MYRVVNRYGDTYTSQHARAVARVANRWVESGKQPIIHRLMGGKWTLIDGVEFSTINGTMRSIFQRVKDLRDGNSM